MRQQPIIELREVHGELIEVKVFPTQSAPAPVVRSTCSMRRGPWRSQKELTTVPRTRIRSQ